MAGPGMVRFSEAGGCLMRVGGGIEEHLEPNEVVGGASGLVVFDLGKVNRITSFGVREWISALHELAASYYCFINCRPAIVTQFNMVSQFGGTGELVTFFAPYVCTKCGSE